MSKTENRKLENKGRIVAYNKLIGLSGLVNVYKNHCSTVYEASECLNVPEDFSVMRFHITNQNTAIMPFMKIILLFLSRI